MKKLNSNSLLNYKQELDLVVKINISNSLLNEIFKMSNSLLNGFGMENKSTKAKYNKIVL